VTVPWALTSEIIAIIASEISTICRPIGTPLTMSDRRIVRSMMK